jgi:hypothetical protein
LGANTTTPAKPIARPDVASRLGRPEAPISHDTAGVSSETVQHSTAASPLGTRNSPHATRPWETVNISMPVIAAEPRARGLGRRAPRHSAKPVIRLPANRQRAAISVQGGIVSTPTRRARKVDPQTMQTAA